MPETATLTRSESPAPSLDADRERMHRQMLSSVSHDLKTPLASIIGSLEVYERMKDKLPEERQKDLIRLALQEAYRLDAFVTNILDMAKFENNAIKPNKEPTNLRALIDSCIMRQNLRMPENSSIQVEAGSEIEAITDPVLVCRALTLILDNAVKYSGPNAQVKVRYGKEDTTGFIEVADNGQGIAAARLETIFSKYTRFASQDKQGAGTGLGLAICRAIMDLLGGSVTAANGSAGGAVFLMRFPLK